MDNIPSLKFGSGRWKRYKIVREKIWCWKTAEHQSELSHLVRNREINFIRNLREIGWMQCSVNVSVKLPMLWTLNFFPYQVVNFYPRVQDSAVNYFSFVRCNLQVRKNQLLYIIYKVLSFVYQIIPFFNKFLKFTMKFQEIGFWIKFPTFSSSLNWSGRRQSATHLLTISSSNFLI